MTFMRSALLLTVLIALAGCITPVPVAKSRYVGEWQGETAYLSITRHGYVYYERFKSRASHSVEGRLKGFKGDNFEIGFGPIATTVVVNRAPYLDSNGWKMVVDGKELVRIEY